jgi:hypothetical protein
LLPALNQNYQFKEVISITTITVTDALAELTLLEKRIESARAGLEQNTLIAYVEIGKVPTGFKSREDYETKARAALQKVDALIVIRISTFKR